MGVIFDKYWNAVLPSDIQTTMRFERICEQEEEKYGDWIGKENEKEGVNRDGRGKDVAEFYGQAA